MSCETLLPDDPLPGVRRIRLIRAARRDTGAGGVQKLARFIGRGTALRGGGAVGDGR